MKNPTDGERDEGYSATAAPTAVLEGWGTAHDRSQKGDRSQSEPALVSLFSSSSVDSVSVPRSLRIWRSTPRRFFSTLSFLSFRCCSARVRATSFSISLFCRGTRLSRSTREAGWRKKKEDEVGGCETDKKGKNEKRRDEGKMEPNELIYSTELGLGCIGGKSVIGKTY